MLANVVLLQHEGVSLPLRSRSDRTNQICRKEEGPSLSIERAETTATGASNRYTL